MNIRPVAKHELTAADALKLLKAAPRYARFFVYVDAGGLSGTVQLNRRQAAELVTSMGNKTREDRGARIPVVEQEWPSFGARNINVPTFWIG